MMKTLLAYLQLLVAQASVGGAIVLGKQLMKMSVPVYLQIEFRFVACFVFLMGLLGLLKLCKLKLNLYIDLHGKDWILICLQSLCAGVLFNLLMLLGLKFTTATMAGMIASVIPAVIALLSYWILKEQLTKKQLIAIVLAIIGVYILHLDTVGHATAKNAILGGFLVFLAIIPEALYTIFAKILGHRTEPIVQASLINLISVLLFLPFSLYLGGWSALMVLEFEAIKILLISSFLSMLFYYYWTAGVAKVSAATAAIFTGVMPIATTITAVLLLGEHFSIYDFTGMVFVLLSIAIGARVSVQKHT